MLNPRNYLEDCIRYGKLGLWTGAFPWEAVDNCINNETFEYSGNVEARQNFEARTKCAWDSLEDDPTVKIECPKCHKLVACPWTTCNEKYMWTTSEAGKLGEGFAERDFDGWCKDCSFRSNISHELLRAHKFRKDVERLIAKDDPLPMPGTFLDKNGRAP